MPLRSKRQRHAENNSNARSCYSTGYAISVVSLCFFELGCSRVG